MNSVSPAKRHLEFLASASWAVTAGKLVTATPAPHNAVDRRDVSTPALRASQRLASSLRVRARVRAYVRSVEFCVELISTCKAHPYIRNQVRASSVTLSRRPRLAQGSRGHTGGVHRTAAHVLAHVCSTICGDSAGTAPPRTHTSASSSL